MRPLPPALHPSGAILPTLSVIIPSYNRCDSVRRAVLSLYDQGFPAAQLEVIVVLDGGADDSAAMLAQLRPPFRLSVIEQTNQGSAAARNRGAAQAAGEILVFVDDDMECAASFLIEHARAHNGSQRRVALGYFEADMQGEVSYFADQLRGWWAEMFRQMRADGHRFAYKDLLSGNFSVPRRLFREVGGFDVTLLRHHDYELGYRLLAAGAEFRLVEAAACIHHEQSSLHRTVMGKLAEGRDDVMLGRLHPDLRPVVPMNWLRRYLALPSRILMRLAFSFPALGDRFAAICESALRPLEYARRYATWLRVLTGLNIYWYWRGVATELGSLKKLDEFLKAPHGGTGTVAALGVQLEDGVAAAAKCLDAERPAAAVLYYGDRLIGRIPALPGTERLAGRHLAPLLSDVFRAPLLAALADTRPTGVSLLENSLAELADQLMQRWTEPQWRV